MHAVLFAASADLPGSALSAWLTLAAGAIALIVLAVWSWLKKSPRSRSAVLAGAIPIAAVAIAGGLYLASDPGSLSAEETPAPLSEDVDIQLPTLSFAD
jgi:hypothetical protein